MAVTKQVKRAYSTQGPVCPFCERMFTPDENYYFDENGYDLDCDECGGVFHVRPDASWSWSSRAKTFEDD